MLHAITQDILIKLFRAEIVRWVSESLRPFAIVEDRGFNCLMKTGRPEYYLPSQSTVSRDVRLVFVNVWKRMAKLMQVCQKDIYKLKILKSVNAGVRRQFEFCY